MEFTETELLLPFEMPRVRGDYREFFKAKRKHFLTTIGYFAELWEAFQLLDGIWSREISNASHQRTKVQFLPTLLLILAHGRYRIAGELAFSGCIADAWGVIRAAIELGVHAHRIHLKPELATIWLQKDDGAEELRAFKEEFWAYKKTRLFDGLDMLYGYWERYSDWGGHSTAAILALRGKFEASSPKINVEISYFEGDESRMAFSLQMLLDAAWLVENILFKIYEDRFNLDAPLLQLRQQFEKLNSDLSDAILAKYDDWHSARPNV